MANPFRAEVEIDLGGEKRTLVFDFNAIAELEELCGGRSIQSIFGFGDTTKLAESMGTALIRKAVYVGLKRRFKGLTLDRVGDMMSEDPRKFGDLMQAVSRGLVMAMFGPGGPTETDIVAVSSEGIADPT